MFRSRSPSRVSYPPEKKQSKKSHHVPPVFQMLLTLLNATRGLASASRFLPSVR